MKHTMQLASIFAFASFSTISQPALAADPAPASKATAAKPAASQTKAPQRKDVEAKQAAAKETPRHNIANPNTSGLKVPPTDASPLMGAFESKDGFLVTVVKSADGNPSKDVLITIVPPTDPKNPRWCQFFGDATITSASQTKVRVTQYQPRHVSHSIPACSVTLEAGKDQLQLSDHSYECELLCSGVPQAYVPKQPLGRLKD